MLFYNIAEPRQATENPVTMPISALYFYAKIANNRQCFMISISLTAKEFPS
jgi:hypothetical protein